MFRYRILEEKGTYKDVESKAYSVAYRYSVGVYDAFYTRRPHAIEAPVSGGRVYVPRYIVQEICYDPIDRTHPDKIRRQFFIDLKEFNDLDEARQYKRELDLEDGIVVE